jgi:transcriptional regulator with XRE-family HTH domain
VPTITVVSLATRWGRRLREARLSAGLTQLELARRAGANQNTISRVEVGEHRPGDNTKFALAAALGTTVEALFPYRDPNDSGAWR